MTCAEKTMPAYPTLYDQYAIFALLGYLSSFSGLAPKPLPAEAAKTAYDFADAMLAQRRKRCEHASE